MTDQKFTTKGLPWKCKRCGKFTESNLVHVCEKWDGGVVTNSSKEHPIRRWHLDYDLQRKLFEEWYAKEELRFHCAQMDEKEIAYSAWLASVLAVPQTVCACEQPWLPIGGDACERCGGLVGANRR